VEKLDQKICLDTDVVISILKGDDRFHSLLDGVLQSEVFISVVTLFELFLRDTNLKDIEEFRERVVILNFDESASRRASAIYKSLKKKGMLVGTSDIFIAAICIVNNCKLVTFNKKDFENINELKLI